MRRTISPPVRVTTLDCRFSGRPPIAIAVGDPPLECSYRTSSALEPKELVTTSLEALKVVPYLDTAQLGGRTIKLMPLWDGERWRQWLPTPLGVSEIKIVDVTEADYVALAPAKDSDLFIPFVHLMWQRASWPEVCPMISAICDDFRNMGISISKLRFFFDHRASLTAVTRFAETELEYMLTVTRSVFDLLQEIISILWKTCVKLFDAAAETYRRGRSLPPTFSKLVLKDKSEPKTTAEIQRIYGLPELFAQEYVRITPFFSQLRHARDAIMHGGSETGHLFITERGFCIDPRAAPFSWFEDWQPEHRYNANLSSVLPWVADLVLKTIDACNRLTMAFAAVVQFPPDIAPGYRVFVRGPQNDALVEALRVRAGGTPWWSAATADLGHTRPL